MNLVHDDSESDHSQCDTSHGDHSHGQSFDGFEMDDIKKNFTALAKELEEGGQPIGEVLREMEQPPEQRGDGPSPEPVFRGYTPTIKDYLARATTVDECEEIIDYCLRQEEISQDEAEEFRSRLERGGPRAFGTRKPGHYDRYS